MSDIKEPDRPDEERSYEEWIGLGKDSIYRVWKKGNIPQDVSQAESPDTSDLCGYAGKTVEVNDVEILEPLGMGSFGEVSLARLISAGKEEEISVKRSSRGTSTGLTSFQREIDLYNLLKANPNPVCEYFLELKFAARRENPDAMMFGLTYVPADDLSKQIKAWKAEHDEDWEKQVYGRMRVILDQLMNALSILQREIKVNSESSETTCVFHLDIKPKNILYRERDQKLWLIDFGSASQKPYNLIEKPQLSRKPDGITDVYAAPELVWTEKDLYGNKEQVYNLHLSADIYSIGATCFHVLMREVPWEGQDYNSIKYNLAGAYKSGDPHELQKKILCHGNNNYGQESIPKPMGDLLSRMLDVNVQYRPTLDEILKTIEIIKELDNAETPYTLQDDEN